MTAAEQQVLTLAGNAGGVIPTTAACLGSISDSMASCVTAGWVVGAGPDIDNFIIAVTPIGGVALLMGTVGENALAAVLAA